MSSGRARDVLGDGTLIITPTYDERANLEPLARAVFAVLPAAHLLVVDDGSPDGTGRLAEELAARDPRISLLQRGRKLGLGTAYVEGFRWGLARGYRYLFEMDADLSHDPAYLPFFLDELERGADLVIGSRNVPGGGVEGWGPGRHLLSKGGSLYARWILGIPVRDLTSGYKGFSRRLLSGLNLERVRSTGYAFQIELTYRALCAGARVVETPIVFADRRVGQSKMDRAIFLQAVIMVWRLRWWDRRRWGDERVGAGASSSIVDGSGLGEAD